MHNKYSGSKHKIKQTFINNIDFKQVHSVRYKNIPFIKIITTNINNPSLSSTINIQFGAKYRL